MGSEYFLCSIENFKLGDVLLILSITTNFILAFVLLFLCMANYLDKKKKKDTERKEKQAVKEKEQIVLLHKLVHEYLQNTNTSHKGISLNQRWELIKNEIDGIFNHFTLRLRLRFSKLSEDEIRLCCLIRIKTDTQHITQYLGISKENLRVRKSRLANNMEISNTKGQLERFIIDF